MEDDEKTRELLVNELTELRSQNAALKKSITGRISAELAAGEVSRYAESIVETVREPLLVLDVDLKIISANRNFYRTFKVIPGETIGCFIYDLGNKQWDIPRLRGLLEEVLPEKEAFDDFEVDHNFQDIGHKVMLLNARQIYRKDIGSKMILLAIEDVTERKRLEYFLTESEERYRRLFETASDGIVLLEKLEGKITNANPATEKMLGYTEEESIGNKLQDIGVSIDMGDFQTTMQNLNKSGILNYRNVNVETKSRQHIDTEIYLVDKAKLVQCNIRDVTEHKRVEKALRESDERYQSLFEQAGDGILILDSDGSILSVNKSFASMHGFTVEEILRMGLDALDVTRIGRTSGRFRRIMNGETLSFEVEHYHKDGHTIALEVTANLVSLGKEPLTIAIHRDLTERKLAENKLQDTLDSLRKAMNTTIQVMVSAVEIRDPYTSGHQIRSADLACAIAMEMGLSQERIVGIRMAGSIHDIGKISIPAEILSKPTKLTDLEFSLIQEHARQGYEILKDIESQWPLAEIVRQHHERMDGSGYPRNLKGEEILMEARILTVADVVEAMASHRPYRPSLGINAALEEIEKNKSILYDNTVVDACLRLFREKGYELEVTS